MPSLYGISIAVLSEGSMLDEYAVETVNERTVGCFVPGHADKAFEILLTNTLNLQDVSVAITVDSVFIGRYYLAPGQKLLPGLYASDSTLRPLKFRSLVFGGIGAHEQSIFDHRCFTSANTGSMEFSIYRCNKQGSEQFKRQNGQDSQGLSTGDERPMTTIDAVRGATLDPEDKPYAKIIIRYRPLEVLLRQGLFLASSRFSTPSSTAVSLPGRKRSLDSTSIRSRDSGRPTQRLRGTPSLSYTGSPYSVGASTSAHSRRSSQVWTAQPPVNFHDSGTTEELTHMKDQLNHATEQMNATMKQMEDSMELMNRSLRQMHVLRQRIEALEAAQQFQPESSPTTSMTLPPIRYQTDTVPQGSTPIPAGSIPGDGEDSTFLLPQSENGSEQWSRPNEVPDMELSNIQWPS